MSNTSHYIASPRSELGVKQAEAVEQIFRCKECSTQIVSRQTCLVFCASTELITLKASSASILSKQFTGQYGRAMYVHLSPVV